jgi:hypothetical protein
LIKVPDYRVYSLTQISVKKAYYLSTEDRLKRILVILSEGDSEEKQQHSFLRTRLQVSGLIDEIDKIQIYTYQV